MTTSSVINPMAVITPMAEGVMALAVISAMSTAGELGMMGAGYAGPVNPHIQLKEINEKIRRTSFILNKQRDGVVSLRNNRQRLMQLYNLTLMPPQMELKRKYPQLYYTNISLDSAEKDLDRLELRMTLLRKQQKELSIKLGIKPEDMPQHQRYPAKKKFVEPMWGE